MAEQKDEKKPVKKTTKLVDPQSNKVKMVPPGKFRPFSKDQQLGKPAKAPKGGRR